MEMKEFAMKVQDAMAGKLGDGYQVKLQEIQKNNNITLMGLVILSDNRNVSPTIYLDSFWEAYEKGMPFYIIMERIMQIYEEDTPKESIDMSFFKNFEEVKNRICFRLVSAEQNKELLTKVPHVMYLDLAICFYYAYQGTVLGNGSILIYNTHMEMWQTTTEKLYELAKNNTPRLFPWECDSMEEVLRGMMPQQELENLEQELEGQGMLEQIPMRVLSNVNRVYGAACIHYPQVLKQLAEEQRANLYVIPSSLHEVIILPDSGCENPERLKEMIAEVNATQVEPEEILSDNLYYYDRLLEQVRIV